MYKFVYFLYGDAYEKCIANAVEEAQNAFAFKPFSNSLIKKIHILHNSRPLNEKRELPLKTAWFRRALKGMDLNPDDDIYFMLYESFHLTYSPKFLRYLKGKYPKCKLCFMYLNPVTELIKKKIDNTHGVFDAIITFNERDAKTYNLVFIPLQPYKLPVIDDDSLPKTDVFFIGSDKGRLSKLIAIYEKLTSAGLKCDFHIIGVEEKFQKYSDDIVYNQKIPYSEVLARVNATKCVLEVLQSDEDYISIRTFEAIQYHRKLLTESQTVKNYSFYNPKIIQVFDSADTINVDFVQGKVSNEEYEYSNPGDVDIFHRLLIRRI